MWRSFFHLNHVGYKAGQGQQQKDKVVPFI